MGYLEEILAQPENLSRSRVVFAHARGLPPDGFRHEQKNTKLELG